MAKDPAMSGPVSDPEGGAYKTSEEVRAVSGEGLTRSEVINEFGSDLGQKLIDGGYASLSSLLSATDEDLTAITGIGPASLEKIREVMEGVSAATVEIEAEITVEESGDVMEEETVTEPEDVEVVEEVADADAVPEVVEVEESEDTGEEVLEETGSGETEEETEVADPPLMPAPIVPAPVEEPQMSVRVRRAKESARKAEEQRQKEQAHWLPGDGDDVVRPDLGFVGVDFVPEEDE